MQIWAESGKSALPICNYSQILYQFLTFTQNLKQSQGEIPKLLLEFIFSFSVTGYRFNNICLYQIGKKFGST